MKNNKRKVDKKIVAQPQSKEIIREKLSHHIFSISLILIISIAIYSNTLKNSFVYDDEFTVVNNTLIKNFSNLSKLWTKEYFNTSGEMSYRPVVTLTYFIDYAIYGLKPWGYHLTNLLLHAINGVILYIFLTLLFKPSLPVQALQTGQYSIFNIQLIISLLFITHPVLTEAVNAISFREDLLCFLFFISAFILYIYSSHSFVCHSDPERSEGEESRLPFILASLSYFFYLLALLSKEMAITFPLIIILYEWIYGGKEQRPLTSPLPSGERDRVRGVFSILFNPYIIGYIAITCVYLYLRFFLFHNPYKKVIQTLTLSEGLMTIPYLILKYLLLLIAPVSLSADYVITPINSIISLKFIIPFIIVSVLVSVSVNSAGASKTKSPVTSHQLPVSIFGILFVLLTLLPVYNIVPIANPFAERYLYLPMLGFAIIIGSTLTWLITHRSSLIAHCSLLIIISIYSFTVIQRNRIWLDDYSLWSDVLIKMPDNSRARYNLGNIYTSQGRLNEAIKEYKIAITLNPDYARAYNNLGNVYSRQDKLEDAIRELLTAIKIKPDYAEAYNNLGNVYFNQGKFDEAIKNYLIAIKIKPDYAEAHNNLGTVYKKQGKFDEAIKEYRMAVEINPDFSEAYNNLGNVYMKQGKLGEAIKEYVTALRLKPDYANAHYNLGNIYHKQGQLEDAAKEYLAAIGLKPEFAIAYRNLGLTYIKQQKIDEAINEFLTALKFNPNDPITHYNMALAYNLKGLNDRAIDELEIALKLKPDYLPARQALESLRRR